MMRGKTYETSAAYHKLVTDLVALQESGDETATRCLAAMALLAVGWRYGDPDPADEPDGPDGGEAEPVRLAA